MTLLKTPSVQQPGQFAADVRAGLTKKGQKELPSKYLYDALGSALFDAITLLPEYGLTRADARLLQRHSRDVATHIAPGTIVTELGSGNGRKTRWLLDALRRNGPLCYYPIEISPAALASCEAELRDIESLSIVGVESEYLQGLAEVVKRRGPDTPVLVLFLGSTIGNFDCGADVRFLRDVRRLLRPGDALLLGTDLIKPEPTLVDAYDDACGVTAAFDLNLLARINRELGADIDLAGFQHRAVYDRNLKRIEMHLVSRAAQTVHVLGRSFRFAAGESIHTENSYKYSVEQFQALAQGAGWRPAQAWTDPARDFSVHELVS